MKPKGGRLIDDIGLTEVSHHLRELGTGSQRDQLLKGFGSFQIVEAMVSHTRSIAIRLRPFNSVGGEAVHAPFPPRFEFENSK